MKTTHTRHVVREKNDTSLNLRNETHLNRGGLYSFLKEYLPSTIGITSVMFGICIAGAEVMPGVSPWYEIGVRCAGLLMIVIPARIAVKNQNKREGEIDG